MVEWELDNNVSKIKEMVLAGKFVLDSWNYRKMVERNWGFRWRSLAENLRQQSYIPTYMQFNLFLFLVIIYQKIKEKNSSVFLFTFKLLVPQIIFIITLTTNTMHGFLIYTSIITYNLFFLNDFYINLFLKFYINTNLYI